jgi:hypothetical protein
MRSKYLTPIVFLIAFCISPFTGAAIFIDGQYQLGQTFDLTDSTYYNSNIMITGESVLSIYYQDSIVDPYGQGDIYQPGVRFNIKVYDSAIINFIIPANDNPDFSFYLWDTGDNEPANFLEIIPGITINPITYSSASYTELWRSYSEDVGQVLPPQIGVISLNGDAVMNFIPEPASLLLLSLGAILIRKKLN